MRLKAAYNRIRDQMGGETKLQEGTKLQIEEDVIEEVTSEILTTKTHLPASTQIHGLRKPKTHISNTSSLCYAEISGSHQVATFFCGTR